MFVSWWRRVLAKLVAGKRAGLGPRRARKRTFSYQIWFEPLEQRWVPDTYQWNSSVASGQWESAGNWIDITNGANTGVFYPGQKSGDVAQFVGLTSPVSVTIGNGKVNENIGTLNFASSANVTITDAGNNNTLTLSTLVASTTNSGTDTIGEALAGTNLTTTVSGGTLFLATVNTFAGSTTVASGGTLEVGGNTSLGSAGLIFAGGTLEASAAVTLANPITFQTTGLSGTIAGANAITLSNTITTQTSDTL